MKHAGPCRAIGTREGPVERPLELAVGDGAGREAEGDHLLMAERVAVRTRAAAWSAVTIWWGL